MGKNRNKEHRFLVYVKSNFCCSYCEKQFTPPVDWDFKKAIYDNGMCLEIDHIKPLSKGGSDKIDNKQSLCQKCNNIKSNHYGDR